MERTEVTQVNTPTEEQTVPRAFIQIVEELIEEHDSAICAPEEPTHAWHGDPSEMPTQVLRWPPDPDSGEITARAFVPELCGDD